MRDAVIVGHNIRFDVSFLNAALQRDQWPPLRHPIVDTCALARRLLRDDVPNCRLGTLASRLRLDQLLHHEIRHAEHTIRTRQAPVIVATLTDAGFRPANRVEAAAWCRPKVI